MSCWVSRRGTSGYRCLPVPHIPSSMPTSATVRLSSHVPQSPSLTALSPHPSTTHAISSLPDVLSPHVSASVSRWLVTRLSCIHCWLLSPSHGAPLCLATRSILDLLCAFNTPPGLCGETPQRSLTGAFEAWPQASGGLWKSQGDHCTPPSFPRGFLTGSLVSPNL